MIVYADNREQRVNTRAWLRSAMEASDPVEKMILFGQLEAALADEGFPEAPLRHAALAEDYEPLLGLSLPEEIAVRTPEGFAFYALYPDAYADAARAFLRAENPESCTVVGIRSIGTTLSTVVERTLRDAGCAASSFTVRPHGHPFDRRVTLTARQHASGMFLVVDEGPGLSGSSFCAVADALNELGVPDERIVFFPSHDPDPNGFVSPRARERWPRHRKYFEPFDRDRYIPANATDLSGGQWRDFLGCDAPAVPQHERRKYLDLQERVLWKWAGLGQYGRHRLGRAQQLSGWIPEPLSLANGFVRSRWVEGCPAETISEDLLEFMSGYLAHNAREFSTDKPVSYSSLIEMIRVNTGIECPDTNPLIEDVAVTAIDGRMLPQEWIFTPEGWKKTDALDHHDDHFFPGCQDVAWDIAGAAVEFNFDAEALAAPYLRLRPDKTLRERLPFYRLAYSAWRRGYAEMSASMLGDSQDGHRWRALAARYAQTAVRDSMAARPANSAAYISS